MTARFVEQGIDRSGPTAKRPARGNMGSLWFDETLGRQLTYDDAKGFWLPVDGAGYVDGSRYLADHFRGPTILSSYSLNKGNDAQAVLPAHVAGSHIGVMRLTAGDAGSGTAADASVWTGPALNWQPSTGEATLILKAALSAITNVAFFIGFTDVLAGTTLEMPFTLSGTTFTSAATDAAGFMFDTAATTDTIRLVGVAADTDATPVDTALAPVAATYNEFKVVITTAGVAKFYLDGTLLGSITGAVTASAALVPIAAVCSRTTSTVNLDVDYALAK